MLKFPAINNHFVGVSAVALTIIGLGMAANSISHRSPRELSEISSTPANQHWVNPAEIEATQNSVAKAIPENAYGYAQPAQSAQPEAATSPAAGTKNARPVAAEGKDWSPQEWEIASKAVSAYRSVANAAYALTKAAPSNNVWQPPEEITNRHSEKVIPQEHK